MSSNREPSCEPYERALNRRTFLGLAAAVAASVGAAPAAASMGAGSTRYETVTQGKLGVALWTCEGEYVVSMPETLDAVAAVGYRYVQAPTTFTYGNVPQGADAKAFRKALTDSGLWCLGMSGAVPYPYDDRAWKTYVHDNLVVGTKYIGTNMTLPATKNECLKYVAAVHKGHEVARRMGFKGPVFNHLERASWVKLAEDSRKYSVEFIMERTTPDVWQPQLDSGHALFKLGSVANVVSMVRRHPGRFPLLHMKDGLAPVGPVGSLPLLVSPTAFGTGDFGRPDPADPQNRPVAGFQDLLTAVRETNDWNKVLILAEQDGSACAEYIVPFYERMNGLKFPYRPRR